MEKELESLITSLKKELENCTKEADVLNVKSQYVGKKSRIAEILSGLKDMTVEEKRQFGSLINNTKKEMENIINNALETLENKVNITFDDTVTYDVANGSLHPVTIVAHEVTNCLKKMGFTITHANSKLLLG